MIEPSHHDMPAPPVLEPAFPTDSTEPTAPEPGEAPARRGRAAGRVGRAALGIAETLVATLIVFLLLQTFVGRTYAVEQSSMESTLEPGQRVIVDLLTPRFDPYKRGDIIVFNPPVNIERGEPLIKRVIAVSGQTVDIRDGQVFVDGRALVEPYVNDGESTEAGAGQSHWSVPQGDLFVLGDNRAVSRDSRAFGPVAVSSVIGRAWLRFYPLNDLRILSTGG